MSSILCSESSGFTQNMEQNTELKSLIDAYCKEIIEKSISFGIIELICFYHGFNSFILCIKPSIIYSLIVVRINIIVDQCIMIYIIK